VEKRNNLTQVYIDRKTVKQIFSYITMYKSGHRLEELVVTMGDIPRIPHRDAMYSYPCHVRPSIQFICHRDQDGNIIVEDDVTEDEHPSWDSYFRIKPLYPGQYWQQNLEQVTVAEEEADRVLREAENAPDRSDVDSLFEES
jgi:hypothetical protein